MANSLKKIFKGLFGENTAIRKYQSSVQNVVPQIFQGMWNIIEEPDIAAREHKCYSDYVEALLYTGD